LNTAVTPVYLIFSTSISYNGYGPITKFVFGISDTKKPLKKPPSVLLIIPFKKKF
jgi:hypothetical protein